MDPPQFRRRSANEGRRAGAQPAGDSRCSVQGSLYASARAIELTERNDRDNSDRYSDGDPTEHVGMEGLADDDQRSSEYRDRRARQMLSPRKGWKILKRWAIPSKLGTTRTKAVTMR